MNSSNPPLDFPSFVALLRSRARLIIGIAVAGAILAFVVSTFFPDKYDADADVLFHQPSTPPRVNPNEPPAEVSSEPERIAATNLALASLDVVAARVKDETQSSMSIEELRDSVSIEPKGQADVVTVTARADTPEEAADIANAFATEIVELRRESARRKIQRVIDAIQAQLAAGGAEGAVAEHLTSRGAQLEVQKRLEAGDAEVVEQATPPDNPSSPKPLRNAGIGGILGLILGVVLALLLRRFDRRVHGDEEIVEMVEAPIVGRIPVIEESGWKQGMALESFQFLRANLQLGSATSESRVFAVTSGLPEEGKSTIALRFAQTLAASGSTVILVDFDLRRPMLHSMLGADGEPGVTNLLTSDVAPEAYLAETDMPNLRLLPAGPLSAMHGSHPTGDEDLDQMIDSLSALADYVVIDTAPVTIGADASTVASVADGTLLVVDAGSVDRAVLAAAAEQLRNAEATIAGIVLNRSEGLLNANAYQGYYAATLGDVAPKLPPPKSRRDRPSAVNQPDGARAESASPDAPQGDPRS
jgi:capsular exopolysaccharide synthesis family protein